MQLEDKLAILADSAKYDVAPAAMKSASALMAASGSCFSVSSAFL